MFLFLRDRILERLAWESWARPNCPLIAQYINANFEQVAQFGDWENPPGWGWNHGTAILKRRDGG